MKRRDFGKGILALGVGAGAGLAQAEQTDTYEEPAKKLPVRKFDVVVAGGGTAGAYDRS